MQRTFFTHSCFSVMEHWNSLNNDIVESNSVVVFKNKLQKYPLEIYSHNYNEVVLIGGPAATRTEQTVKYVRVHLLEILH
jgi:hypothetical protein